MDAQRVGGVADVAAAVGEHALDVLPLHPGERRRAVRGRPVRRDLEGGQAERLAQTLVAAREGREHVIGVAVATNARMVVTFGALLAEVPHSRPVSVFGATYDEASTEALDLLPSRYEGPTGITGVLHNACSEAGIRSAALWAAVPTYVPSSPSPKAALALIDRAARLLEVTIDTTELKFATDAYEHQVSLLVAEDEETTEYVAHLEQRYDEEPDRFTDGESLVDEVERFLRDQD